MRYECGTNDVPPFFYKQETNVFGVIPVFFFCLIFRPGHAVRVIYFPFFNERLYVGLNDCNNPKVMINGL